MNIIIDNCTFTDNIIATDFELTKPNHAAPEIITVASSSAFVLRTGP